MRLLTPGSARRGVFGLLLGAAAASLLLAACGGGQRLAAGPVDVLGPLAPQPAPAALPVEPGAEPAPAPGPPGLGWLDKGSDMCVFNKLDVPITMNWHRVDGTQGDSPIVPGGWNCGYDGPNFWGNSEARGDLVGIPGEQRYIDISGTNSATTAFYVEVFTDASESKYVCHIYGYKVGQSETLDVGTARLVAGRNADDADWMYFYVNVEPSQGASPKCAGS